MSSKGIDVFAYSSSNRFQVRVECRGMTMSIFHLRTACNNVISKWTLGISTGLRPLEPFGCTPW